MRWIFADFPKIADLSEICDKSLDLPVDPQESDHMSGRLCSPIWRWRDRDRVDQSWMNFAKIQI